MNHTKPAIRTSGAFAAAALLLTGVAATPAAAQTFVPCSPDALASAITDANTSGGTLVLAPGCVYALTTALPSIQNTITIQGDSATITRAALAPAFRILTVDATGDLDLRSAVISNGDATGDFGGGIRNDGVLTVRRSVIRDNHGDYSGGIGGNTGSTTHVYQSLINGNTALHNGGALANDGTMTIVESTVINNSALETGGGVANDATPRVLRSTVVDNAASGPTGVGAGVANFGGAGATTTLTRSRVVDNSATNAPGGVFNDSGTVTLDFTVVAANNPTNCAASPTVIPGCVG
jgi:predicted outer membrane repeat protein